MPAATFQMDSRVNRTEKASAGIVPTPMVCSIATVFWCRMGGGRGRLRMVTLSRTAQNLLRLPLVEAGDHLDQATFHERYKAMPAAFRAELIGGVVIVPSPLSWGHGVYHALVIAWLGNYCIATPGTLTADNITTILGELSEPQPDGVLIIEPAAGGPTGLSEDDYTTGPPELIVEIASSSASIDLHAKRRDYEQ